MDNFWERVKNVCNGCNCGRLAATPAMEGEFIDCFEHSCVTAIDIGGSVFNPLKIVMFFSINIVFHASDVINTII